jgi:hypothetical protein
MRKLEPVETMRASKMMMMMMMMMMMITHSYDMTAVSIQWHAWAFEVRETDEACVLAIHCQYRATTPRKDIQTTTTTTI